MPPISVLSQRTCSVLIEAARDSAVFSLNLLGDGRTRRRVLIESARFDLFSQRICSVATVLSLESPGQGIGRRAGSVRSDNKGPASRVDRRGHPTDHHREHHLQEEDQPADSRQSSCDRMTETPGGRAVSVILSHPWSGASPVIDQLRRDTKVSPRAPYRALAPKEKGSPRAHPWHFAMWLCATSAPYGRCTGG